METRKERIVLILESNVCEIDNGIIEVDDAVVDKLDSLIEGEKKAMKEGFERINKLIENEQWVGLFLGQKRTVQAIKNIIKGFTDDP